jgi:tetratricopeptide (TPR) repeat protein
LQKLAEAEEQVLRQYPHRSRPDIVMSLLRRQSELFKKLDRPQDALAALISMVALEQNDATALTEVLQTLIDRKAWTELDQVVLRFADRIQQDAMVSYTVAHAYQLQGKTAEVARYVAAAAKLNAEDQRQHIITAIALHRKGYHEWSDAEYRSSIALGRPGDPLTLTAQIMFGESLHERQLDLEAGKILDEASKGMEAAVANGIDLSESGRNLSANRARAHYFYAAHAESQGDVKEQERHLLEGLGEDPHDTEVLIALYRMKNLHATVRERVINLIGESIADYRAQIQASPDDDTPYNQLAWLISNTQGDFNEAVNASLKSLEIKPDNPGHLDTLGRCYFALGDYENAVKQQSRAIELDPHSEPMKRQLAEFQAALKKSKQ